MTRLRRYKSVAVQAAFGFVVCGCSQFIPRYPALREVPQNALIQAQEASNAAQSTVSSDWLGEEWWTIFCDRQLTELIQRSLSNHPSMRAAEARVNIAVAAFKRERAPMFPAINAVGDYTRWRNSKNGIFGLAPQFPLTYTQPEASINFAYEFDFWRKHANLAGAAADEVHAREAEGYQTALILSLTVADAYFEQQIFHQRKLLADMAVENRKLSEILSGKRKAHRIEDKIATNAAKIGVQAALQYSDGVADELAKSRFALQALLGGDFEVPVNLCEKADWFCGPMPLPAAVPLELLAHRPDVWALRWRADAAAKEICVARAGFYPNINLLAYGGLQSIVPSKFFEAQSFYGTIGPAFQLPIFVGGALRANLEASYQSQVLAIAEYEEAVLNAVKEVLEGLAHLTTTRDRYGQMVVAEGLAEESLVEAKRRLENNIVSKAEVLLYEYEWIQARDNTLQALLSHLKARLGLIRALGGGTEPACDG